MFHVSDDEVGVAGRQDARGSCRRHRAGPDPDRGLAGGEHLNQIVLRLVGSTQTRREQQRSARRCKQQHRTQCLQQVLRSHGDSFFLTRRARSELVPEEQIRRARVCAHEWLKKIRIEVVRTAVVIEQPAVARVENVIHVRGDLELPRSAEPERLAKFHIEQRNRRSLNLSVFTRRVSKRNTVANGFGWRPPTTLINDGPY